MLSVLTYIFCFIVFGFIGYAVCYHKHKHTDLVGSILIVEQDNEDTTLLLEIYNGKKEDIKPGAIIKLGVEKYEK